MSEPTTTTVTEWATFEVEREWPVPPHDVFRAFADPKLKAKWFGEAPAQPGSAIFEFQVGGREYNKGADDQRSYEFDAVYLDIIEDQRIAYSYQMTVDSVKLSVSLTVVTIEATAAGSRTLWREAAAFFDGTDDSNNRQEGTEWLMDALGRSLTA